MKMNAYTRFAMLAVAMAFAGAASANEGKQDKFAMMDTDGNGMVSTAEHAAGAQAMFERMDSDRDGSVTVAEMDATHMRKEAKTGAMSSADKIAKIDTDGNGMLSAAEHAAGAQRKFAEMDANGDGSLDQAEMKAGHKAMKGKTSNDAMDADTADDMDDDTTDADAMGDETTP